MDESSSLARLSGLVIRGLAAGHPVKIDGLGTFYPDAARGFLFRAAARPKVFIAYVEEDRKAAESLYDVLEAAGFTPWMDVRKLLPGQNWPRSIEQAIETADFFVACFSTTSVNKRGDFQAEIRYALDCARRVPLEATFLLPVRLDACPVPRSIQRQWQYVDLFPDWSDGARGLVRLIRQEVARRWERQGAGLEPKKP